MSSEAEQEAAWDMWIEIRAQPLDSAGSRGPGDGLVSDRHGGALLVSGEVQQVEKLATTNRKALKAEASKCGGLYVADVSTGAVAWQAWKTASDLEAANTDELVGNTL